MVRVIGNRFALLENLMSCSISVVLVNRVSSLGETKVGKGLSWKLF